MQDTHITLAHGNGGRYMRELIEQVFVRHLGNSELDTQADAVALSFSHDIKKQDLLFTTDGFTVQPLEYPGGNIGSLAVHGTCNDLAVSGAIPKYLSLNAFIEEGLEILTLERIIKSMAMTATETGVKIVTGDTKVLPRGQVGGLYLATSGIGLRQGPVMSMRNIKQGDVMLVSGPIGDHGIAVMLAREEFGLTGEIKSDAASVLALTTSALKFKGLRFMRDPTRGGLATLCTELVLATGMGLRLMQEHLPVRDTVQGVCDMLGYDPLYLACEGRVIAIVDPAEADALLVTWQNLEQGRDAAIIGVVNSDAVSVVVETEIGGERILEALEDDPLPRIC